MKTEEFKGKIVLNLDKLHYSFLNNCDLIDVIINVNINEYDMRGSYYYNEDIKKIFFDRKHINENNKKI